LIIDRFLAEDDIEFAAARLITDYEAEFRERVAAPVDIDHIGEAFCKLCFDWEFLPELLDQHPELAAVLSDEEKRRSVVLGGLYPRKRLVVLNEKHLEAYNKQPGRERFTKAHEIGHWVLHIDKSVLDQPSLFGDGDETQDAILCRDGDKSRLEWQANRFAAALLMPKALFLDVALPLNLGTWQAQYELRERFNVTISTLVIRLKQLGLTYVDKDGVIHRSEAEAHGQLRLK
jgi:hypothetical protein